MSLSKSPRAERGSLFMIINTKGPGPFSLLQLGEDSDYDKLSDMVRYLDLELHFGTQKTPSE